MSLSWWHRWLSPQSRSSGRARPTSPKPARPSAAGVSYSSLVLNPLEEIMRGWLRQLRRVLVGGLSTRRPAPYRLALEPLEERALLATGFLQTNLVSNTPGLAEFTDANLENPWGLTASGTSPFWVSDNQTGFATLYNGQGVKIPLTVSFPSAANSPFTHATPTGTVFNTDPDTSDFKFTDGTKSGAGIFLFDTLDGTIDGWIGQGTTNAVVALTVPGAVYTGLAIDTTADATATNGDTLLYAADWGKGTVDVFNGSFQQIDKGSFVDAAVPKTFRPFGIQDIDGNVWVTYAQFDRTTGADTGTGGFVAEFSRDGVLEQTIKGPTKGAGQLNSPWGLALAPQSFGDFGGDLLVGNFGDGTINAFDPHNGNYLGTLSSAAGQPITIGNLWALRFGNGTGSGSTNTLFFTAGVVDAPATKFGATGGLLGSLQVLPNLNSQAALLPNLQNGLVQTFSTVSTSGDQNPYGVAFAPQGFQTTVTPGQNTLHPGDLLVSNFNNAGTTANPGGQQGLGSSIIRITPQGATSTWFQAPAGLGLDGALGVLQNGDIIVGALPTVATGSSAGQVIPDGGSLLVIDANGKLVRKITDSDLLDSPWGLTINDKGNTAQIFVVNAVSGTVVRINVSDPLGGKLQVQSETVLGSGYMSRTDPNALVVGPAGLAYDAKTDTLYVASTEDNTIFAIKKAGKRTTDAGTGTDIFNGFSDPHLRGPIGLILAPNGDLIVANGDAINADPTGVQNSDLVEFTPDGHFVGEFQVDPTAGSAFGLAATDVNGQLRFAAVDDSITGKTPNSVIVWNFDTGAPSPQPSAKEAASSGSSGGSGHAGRRGGR
jgi:uncharacterized protein (TIGR03118 family)